jgi:ribA/ribD-fused uncharacterized protein
MIDSFKGEYAFLSNFYQCNVVYEGEIYPSVEHAYQASKTLDHIDRAIIRVCGSASKAKKLGGKIKLRPHWNTTRLVVMKKLIWQKFDQPELGRLLLATGNQRITEGNNWGDTFWGTVNGMGEDVLGQLLMEKRHELRSELRV